MALKRLSKILSEQFGVSPDTITRATSFEEDLGADSLDIAELTLLIEEEFFLGEIEDDAIPEIKTVGDVVDFIVSRVPDADD